MQVSANTDGHSQRRADTVALHYLREGTVTALQNVLTNAVDANDVPFVVGMVANGAGNLFSGAAGPARDDVPAGEDTLFRVFSMTKAIGSLAAMILIDRDQLSLETPVADILPQWNALRVLEGYDEGEPIWRKPTRVATTRHLMTHTAGLEYDHWCGATKGFLNDTGHPMVMSGQKSALIYPMMCDPGTRWGYGISTDWLGQMVEAIDGRRIDVFCEQEIFQPLGMTSTVFELDGLEHKLANGWRRGADGTFSAIDLRPPSQPEFYGMGHALYSSAPDYLRFLRLILNDGALEGERLLSPTAVAMMRTDQMRGLNVTPMPSVSQYVSADVDFFPGTPLTHTTAFMRNEADIPGKRSAGSLSWAGVMNTHYWIDPARDVAAVLMTQSLPFVEPRLMKTYDAYERAVYASL